jgi:hypothetical protein
MNGSDRPLSGGAHVKEKMVADIPAWTVHDLTRLESPVIGDKRPCRVDARHDAIDPDRASIVHRIMRKRLPNGVSEKLSRPQW